MFMDLPCHTKLSINGIDSPLNEAHASPANAMA
jgi:hypothetical protein